MCYNAYINKILPYIFAFIGFGRKRMFTDILAQIASFLALAFIVSSYFTSKKNYLLFQALGIIGLMLSYLLKSNYFAMVGMVLALSRSVTFYVYEKFEKKAPVILSVLFSALTVTAYFIVNVWIQGSGKYVDILYLVSLIFYAFTFRIRDRRLLLYTTLIPTGLALIYSIASYTTLFVVMSYGFEFAANITALAKFYLDKRKSECESQTNTCSV